MKRIIAAGLVALSSPRRPLRRRTTTVQEVTTKGIVLERRRHRTSTSTYKPDGTFTAMDGAVTGKWRIDGEKLCTSSNFERDGRVRGLSGRQEIRRLVRRDRRGGTATIKIK